MKLSKGKSIVIRGLSSVNNAFLLEMPFPANNDIIISMIVGQYCRMFPAASTFWRQNFSRVRQQFYNADYFAAEPSCPAPVTSKAGKFRFDLLACNLAICLGAAVLCLYFLPLGLFKLFPNIENHFVQVKANDELRTQAQPSASNSAVTTSDIILTQILNAKNETKMVMPSYNFESKDGRWLKIDSVGIETEIYVGTDINNEQEINNILARGVYGYPGSSQLGMRGKTVILAGHHYNIPLASERAKATFQNLNQVEVGDIVEISEDYKKWRYQIYKIETAREITEDDADLLMYTCVFWWDSNLRLFVYGVLLDA